MSASVSESCRAASVGRRNVGVFDLRTSCVPDNQHIIRSINAMVLGFTLTNEEEGPTEHPDAWNPLLIDGRFQTHTRLDRIGDEAIGFGLFNHLFRFRWITAWLEYNAGPKHYRRDLKLALH